MPTYKKIQADSYLYGESTVSVAKFFSWVRHTGLYAFLAMAIVFTGCDTGVVDNGTALSSDNIMIMQKNGDNDLAPVCEVSTLDVSLVLDISGSMSGSRLTAAKNGAKALVATLSASDQGALVSFASQAQRNLDLTLADAAGKSDLDNAIDNLAIPGSGVFTNIQGGIIYGAEELTGNEGLYSFLNTTPSGKNRAEATKIMVVLSDGAANRYYNNDGNVVSGPLNVQTVTNDAATVAKGAGIRIFTISIGGANPAAMASYASSPDDAYTSADLNDLTAVFEEIAQSICPTPVAIDIKPGSDPNSINPERKGVISVGVFTTDDFDATTINPETVRFGSLSAILSDAGAELAHKSGHIEDVDGDGRPDFVGHFSQKDTGFEIGDETGWLIGETLDGESFAGTDAVRILVRGKPPVSSD